jgi:hypothetical protein
MDPQHVGGGKADVVVLQHQPAADMLGHFSYPSIQRARLASGSP